MDRQIDDPHTFVIKDPNKDTIGDFISSYHDSMNNF